jgi:hypothetical protein
VAEAPGRIRRLGVYKHLCRNCAPLLRFVTGSPRPLQFAFVVMPGHSYDIEFRSKRIAGLLSRRHEQRRRVARYRPEIAAAPRIGRCGKIVKKLLATSPSQLGLARRDSNARRGHQSSLVSRKLRQLPSALLKAADFSSEGHGFESHRAHQKVKITQTLMGWTSGAGKRAALRVRNVSAKTPPLRTTGRVFRNIGDGGEFFAI